MPRIKIDINQLSSGFIVPLLILVIAASAYFVLLPKYKALNEAKQVLVEKQTEVSEKEAQLQGVRDLISDLKSKKEQLASLDEALPDAPRVPELLANVESLSLSSGLLMSNLQLTIPQRSSGDSKATPLVQGISGPLDNLGIVQVDLILKGKYVNLKTFLTNLEQNLRLMDILSLTFTPIQEENDAQDFALKIQTYYDKH